LAGGSQRVYACSGSAELRQGEILSILTQTELEIGSVGADQGVRITKKVHPLAIILSQDCDLDLDFKARNGQVNDDKLLPNILFCEVITAAELKQSGGMNSPIWGRVEKNKDERYQFLQKVEPADDAVGQGVDEMGIDFKRYFTIPTAEVYEQLKITTRRRCRLNSPYLEHLSQRFAQYLCRIALPLGHASE
jgi:hypothetical protein